MHVQIGRRAVTAAAVFSVALSLVGCGTDHSANVTSGGVAWEGDLQGALKRAGAEQKLVMVDFYADWCMWCKRLDETTYADASVQRALKDVVPVKLDTEGSGRDAARRFRVDGLPTLVFLDPQGREVARIPGYLGPQPFLRELESILRRS